MTGALRPGASFASFAEFESALKSFQRVNNVVFVVGSSKSIAWANKKLQPGEVPYADELQYKHLTMKCKSGGYDRPSTSKGLRPHQR